VPMAKRRVRLGVMSFKLLLEDVKICLDRWR